MAQASSLSPASQETTGLDREKVTRIVAFVADEASATALRSGLMGISDDLDIRKGNIRQAIRAFERDAPPQKIIVDIDGVPDPQTALEDLAGVCPPDVTVIVTGEIADIGFYRILVNDLGVAEYVHKPLTRDNVHRLMLPHLGIKTGAVGSRGGAVVAVCGAHGGVGATTIALNCAFELAEVAKGHVAILDLHLQGGTTALLMSQRPGHGLRSALEDPDRVDSLFLERTAITLSPRLKLIAAQEPFNTTPTIDAAGLDKLIELLRQKFNFVVVDLPMPTPPAMQRVIALARHFLVVLGPDIASVRDVRAIRQLVSAVAGNDRLMTVLNRADLKGGLSAAMVEKGLGAKPDVIIPDLGKRMLDAANRGVPAAEYVSGFRAQLAPLMREIAGTRTSSTSSSFWGRLIRR